jgi:ATP-binding protein involved in chromosome partitioning
MDKKSEGVQIAGSMPKKEPTPEESAASALSNIRNKFLVMSGKGGVGKTSTAVNLSIALARKGYKVGLMDVDLHGPDIPKMLGLEGSLGITESQKIQPKRFSDNLGVVSIESLLPDRDEAVIWRGPVKYNAIRQFIEEVEWGELDYLIIDAPPGTGDEPLTIAQLIRDAKAIIVTTPQEVALADVRKSISFCHRVELDIFGLIENMSGFTCPHCRKAVDLLGNGGGERTAETAGIPFLGKIPFDPRMVSCSDSGVSFQEQHKDAEAAVAFIKVAEEMSKLIAS